jgi:hypothetical protein
MSFKWKKVPIFESINVLPGEERKIIKYVQVNRLSNYQLLKYSKEDVYKTDYPDQVKQMGSLIEKRNLV